LVSVTPLWELQRATGFIEQQRETSSQAFSPSPVTLPEAASLMSRTKISSQMHQLPDTSVNFKSFLAEFASQ
jgi:hypothetical protein